VTTLFSIVTHVEASAIAGVIFCDDVTMLSSLDEETRNAAEEHRLTESRNPAARTSDVYTNGIREA